MIMSKVNVYNDKGDIIARVDYNSILDSWSELKQTFCSAGGATGTHKGLTKTEDGRYVLIHRTDKTEWKDKEEYAEIISAQEAVSEMMRSCNTQLLERVEFSDLKTYHDSLGLLKKKNRGLPNETEQR